MFVALDMLSSRTSLPINIAMSKTRLVSTRFVKLDNLPAVSPTMACGESLLQKRQSMPQNKE